MLQREKLLLSFAFSFAFLFLTSSGNALLIDDFKDVDSVGDELAIQAEVNSSNPESWNNGKLANAIGGCRLAKIADDGRGVFTRGKYAHNQDDGYYAKTVIAWGECKNGTKMSPVDLRVDGAEYFVINNTQASNSNGKIKLRLTDVSSENEAITCDKKSETEYRCNFSDFDEINLNKIQKIELIIDGNSDMAYAGFDFGVTGVKTGSDNNTVCGVIPSPSNNYGAKDECGLCPGTTGYGDGKDECGFCPNDTLPAGYAYGDGKICPESCDSKGNCGWCPSVDNPGKGNYLCTQCDDGLDNDGEGKVDCKDPECMKGVNGSCDPSYDSEAPQCSNKKDDDKDGLIDRDDPACHDENGNYDPNLDSEADDPACSDGVDNDGDKLVDDKDPGCYEKNPNTGKYEYKPYKKSEEGPNTECSDGKDNDKDGYVDSKDPDCWYPDSTKLGGSKDYSGNSPFYDWNPWDPSESGATTYQCSDGIDNDKDGLIDAEDPGCIENGKWNPKKDSEYNGQNGKPQCSDGVDNDGDKLIDYPDDPGCVSKDDDSEDNSARKPECSDGIDNDKDGKIDDKDPSCYDTDANGNPIKYNPNLDDETGCSSTTNVSNLSVDDERLATIGLNAAKYLRAFHKNSSSAFKRTTKSADRAGTKITKEINKVITNLKNYTVSCNSISGTSCRNNNNSQLNSFGKQVNNLNKLVRRAQRRGLFFKKNFEKKAISAKKQKQANYNEPKTLMTNNRKANTRTKVYNNINQKISSIKSLVVCK